MGGIEWKTQMKSLPLSHTGPALQCALQCDSFLLYACPSTKWKWFQHRLWSQTTLDLIPAR